MRRTKIPPHPFRGRLLCLTVCFSFLLLILGFRLFQLHILHQDFLRAQGNARAVRTVNMPSYRGMITDRRGEPLAVSTPVDAIWIDPRKFNPTTNQLTVLSKHLGIPSDKIIAKQEENAGKAFIYLRRDVTPDLADALLQLHITGLYRKREYRRYYPAGPAIAQLIGFTDIDDIGQSGLELYLEPMLKPRPGKKRVLEDRTGNWIQDLEHIQQPLSGRDISITIDARVQASTYQILLEALEKNKAKSATVVIIDIPTGEILTMVSAPSFNPNNRQTRTGPNVRLRAITDPFEPGSTIKAFALAAALSSGEFKIDSPIDTNPGFYKLGSYTIKDVSKHGRIPFKDVLIKSSNVGIIKIILQLGAEPLVDLYRNLGLGTNILLGLPGEHSGMLQHRSFEKYAHASFGFGYGFSVTALQLANAYAILGNHGIEKPLSIFKTNIQPRRDDYQVMNAQVASDIVDILEQTTRKNGTGKRAHITGFSTAGKTGTVRVVGPNGYDENRHIAIFTGITPAHNPRLATVVVVEEPQGQYYGGLISAPIYAKVVGQALHILNVPPDKK